MYTDDLRHANVTDTKKEWNIMPFPCNCREPALPDQEVEIKDNIADCQANGVCKYLMDLEEKWENIVFNEPEHIALAKVSYKEFPNGDPDGGLNVGSVNVGTWQNEKKQGITLTSVLFCKYGGFIYPLTSGQELVMLFKKDRYSLTDEELQKLGFLFQIGDERMRTQIFDFLFPILYLDGSSYG